MFKKFNVTVIYKVMTLNNNGEFEAMKQLGYEHLKLNKRQYNTYMDRAKKTNKNYSVLKNETVVWA